MSRGQLGRRPTGTRAILEPARVRGILAPARARGILAPARARSILEPGRPAPRRGLRALQLALAGCWAIDALLQLAPANFSGALVYETILGNAEHQPQPIYDSLTTAARLLAPVHVMLNVAIIVVQLTIAAGILWPRSTRVALAASIPWALGVWWLGEGFGGVFAGKATLLVGFPGPALMYALLALVAWPRERAGEAELAGTRQTAGGGDSHAGGPGASIAAQGLLGERATAWIWALLWVGGAILRAVPFWFSPVYALTGDLQLGLNEEPHWLFDINMRLSSWAAAAGLPLVVGMAMLEAAIGLGVLSRHRRPTLICGGIVAAVYWAVGQQFASLFTASATDIAAGPLYVLLAIALWPARRVGPRGLILAGLPAPRMGRLMRNAGDSRSAPADAGPAARAARSRARTPAPDAHSGPLAPAARPRARPDLR